MVVLVVSVAPRLFQTPRTPGSDSDGLLPGGRSSVVAGTGRQVACWELMVEWVGEGTYGSTDNGSLGDQHIARTVRPGSYRFVRKQTFQSVIKVEEPYRRKWRSEWEYFPGLSLG